MTDELIGCYAVLNEANASTECQSAFYIAGITIGFLDALHMAVHPKVLGYTPCCLSTHWVMLSSSPLWSKPKATQILKRNGLQSYSVSISTFVQIPN